MSKLALQLIAENKAKHERGEDARYLDLGYCGLTELPAAIGELIWLETLILSNEWRNFDFEKRQEEWIKSRNKDKKNHIKSIAGVEKLKMLKKLVVAKEYKYDLEKKNNWALSDLSPLSDLKVLRHLDCSSTQVNDLSPLSGLKDLQILRCSFTQVSDLSPLSGLKVLQYIRCDFTQVSNLSPLEGLGALQIFYCSSTEVGDLSPLIGLTDLQLIWLYSTQVSNLSPLAGMKALQHFSCTSTQVSDLSPLAGLKVLQHLNCSFTQVSDLSPLSGLKVLQHLECSGTQVSDLSPLPGLKVLQHLECVDTQVSDLSPLVGLTTLQILYCSNTPVNDLSPLAGLTNLQQLYCSNTPVNDLSPLAGLTNLQQLFCFNTPVSDLSSLAELTALQRLYCSNTPVSDLSPLKKIIQKGTPVKWSRHENGICVEDCPLTNPPREIVEQGNEAILSYWEQIEKQGGTEIINEAKLIIVGEGKTGKTTLFNKLIDPHFDLHANPTDETHGINIHEGLVFKDDFRANLWDFGGQELQYMTHQFFLTPKALYVLMMEARAEAPNLAYWFKIISLLGKDRSDEKVSLLLVLNKRKGSTGMPQYQDLLQLYEEDYDYQFLEVDFSDNDKRWECLTEAIAKGLFELPIVKNALPKQWKPIREALREESKTRNYITTDRLHEICSGYGVTVEAEQWQMTDYLHQLGSLLHFQNDPDLMDLVILRPEWAVEGVYSTLKSDLIKEVQKGKFSAQDIFHILRAKGYSNTDSQKILKLMSKNNFDICYESESKGHYVAAQLLPDNAPVYPWFPQEVLQFTFQYPMMPKGLMSRLIVRLSKDIEHNSETGEEMVWKKGVVLFIKTTEGACRVRVREDDAESKSGLRQITIEVMGDRDARKYALRRVRDCVEDLHKRWFRNIKVDEMVPCCCSECIVSEAPQLFKLESLLKRRLKRPDTSCDVSGEDLMIQTLLEGVYDMGEIQAFPQNAGGVHIQNYHQHGGQANLADEIHKINEP